MHLKKVLALVLAFACAFTMFAGAAFTDQADIKVDSEVVDTLVSLGVIEGFENGSFQPNGTVTRAQMAKMIYVLRTGNSDASAYNNDKTTFTDINGHWAAGYIKYCQSLNIIAGKSATKFCPNDKVTTQEAAKMLLVTLGYDAKKAGLVGAGWASKTNALADENGLLEDVNTSFTGACPRQYAAQLIYNTIFAPTVVLRDDVYTNENYAGHDNKTVGEKYMGLKTTVGTLDTVSKESGKDTYKLTIGETGNTKDDSTDPLVKSFTKVKKDYNDLLDQEVKVLYKAKDDVYGVFATEDSDVLTGVLGDFEKSDAKLKFNGSKYSVGEANATKNPDDSNLVKVNGTKATNDTNVNNIVAYVDAAAKGLSKVYSASTRSKDNKIVQLNVKTVSIAQVTYVGKDYINATKKAGPTFDKIDTDSSNYPSDLKKDDYIAIYNANNFSDDKQVVEKLDVVEGKVTSTKNKITADDYSIMVDGNWYEMAMQEYANNSVTSETKVELKDEVAVVVKDGYVVYVDDNKAGSKDVALLVKAVTKTSANDDDIEGRLIFADGSDKTVTIKNTKMFASITEYTGTPVLVSYKKSGEKYELTKVTAKIDGYDEYDTSAVKVKDNKLVKANGAAADKIPYIDNTATVFVKYQSGTDTKYTVITGSALKNWSDSKIFTSQVLSKKTNGMHYAKTMYVNLADQNMSGGKDITYGYVLEASRSVTENDTDYTTTKVWNGTEEITLKVEDGDALAEGQVVEYSVNSDGTHDIENTYTLDSTADGTDHQYALTRGVVTGFDYNAKDVEGTLVGSKAKKVGDDYIADETEAAKFTLNISNDDHESVVLFVDTDNARGTTGGEFQKAAENNDGKKLANVAYYADASSNVKIIIVDTQNIYAK
ncbi:MAG: S-layer homology domain-containing protein [Eubacteriales bacterium]